LKAENGEALSRVQATTSACIEMRHVTSEIAVTLGFTVF